MRSNNSILYVTKIVVLRNAQIQMDWQGCMEVTITSASCSTQFSYVRTQRKPCTFKTSCRHVQNSGIMFNVQQIDDFIIQHRLTLSTTMYFPGILSLANRRGAMAAAAATRQAKMNTRMLVGCWVDGLVNWQIQGAVERMKMMRHRSWPLYTLFLGFISF